MLKTIELSIFSFWLCHTAYRILVPRLGIEPRLPALEARFPTTGPPGNPLLILQSMVSEVYGKYSSIFLNVKKCCLGSPGDPSETF